MKKINNDILSIVNNNLIRIKLLEKENTKYLDTILDDKEISVFDRTQVLIDYFDDCEASIINYKIPDIMWKEYTQLIRFNYDYILRFTLDNFLDALFGEFSNPQAGDLHWYGYKKYENDEDSDVLDGFTMKELKDFLEKVINDRVTYFSFNYYL